MEAISTAKAFKTSMQRISSFLVHGRMPLSFLSRYIGAVLLFGHIVFAMLDKLSAVVLIRKSFAVILANVLKKLYKYLVEIKSCTKFVVQNGNENEQVHANNQQKRVLR